MDHAGLAESAGLAQRVPGPNADLWRGAPAPNSCVVCGGLQSGPHTPGITERCAVASTGPTVLRHYRHSHFSGTASSIRADMIFGKDTHLSAGETVPIGWIAVGNPAQVLPPGEHERIWHIQKLLDFPLTVYGIERGEATTGKITHRLAENLHSHASDEVMM